LGYLFYQLIGWLLFLALFPFLLIYCLGGEAGELSQRLGFSPRRAPGGGRRLWLHAASVGEVQAARMLVDEILEACPDADIVVSTLTRHGQEVLKNQLGDRVTPIFAPLDLGWFCRRAMRSIRPEVYVCLETELWPSILAAARAQGVTTLLVNGRLTVRSLARYRLIRGMVEKMLTGFAALAVISEEDGRRFTELGADPSRIVVTGNAKYDVARIKDASPARLRERLGLEPGRPVAVLGSTHTGEERMFAPVIVELTREIPGMVWIIAPRHIRRIPEVAEILKGHGLGFDLYSTLTGGRSHDIVLVDTVGDLASLYSVASWVFCGGSLVARGGHNLFEAAAWGVPVLFGPHMDDFDDVARLLREEGGGFQVSSAGEAGERILAWHRDPNAYLAACNAARKAALRQVGAAARQAEIILAALTKGHGDETQDRRSVTDRQNKTHAPGEVAR